MARPDSGADGSALRLNILAVVAIALFGALFARLWFLQVLTGEEAQIEAELNTFREIPIEAPRGRILDVNDKVLVDNETIIVVTMDAFVMREKLPALADREAMALRLATEISEAGKLTKAATIFDAMNDTQYGPFEKIPLAVGVPQEFRVWLVERLDEFPGIETAQVTVRRYPYGNAAAHLLGYIGPLTQEELDGRTGSAKPYQPSDDIGKSGVELVFEDHLRGVPGKEVIEVDRRGNIVRFRPELYQAPVPGSDIRLTIDIDQQVNVEQRLQTALEAARAEFDENTGTFFPAPAGAVVVLDPDGAEVVAMASFPTFDPREFIDGISEEQFATLTKEGSNAPLNNRAIQGVYAPGSTVKPFTAYAALNTGLIGPRGVWGVDTAVNDPGYYTLRRCLGEACERQNADREAYGEVDLPRSLTVSSDVYYYKLAEEFSLRPGYPSDTIQENFEIWGLGGETNVPLPFEASGRIPTPELRRTLYEQFPELFFDGEWRTGDTLNVAIGQGDVGVTPLQLANAYATLANDGTRYAPNVADAVLDPVTGEVLVDFGHRVVDEIYLPESMQGPLIAGLQGVTQQEEGTAFEAFNGVFNVFSYPVAGKTGTAEVFEKSDSSLFAAFGPVEEPDYVVAAVLEEAGFGGDVAAPLVAQIFAGLVDGVPEVPTLDEVDRYYEELAEQQLAAQAAEDELAAGGGG